MCEDVELNVLLKVKKDWNYSITPQDNDLPERKIGCYTRQNQGILYDVFLFVIIFLKS